MASVNPCSSAWSTAMVSMAICMRATATQEAAGTADLHAAFHIDACNAAAEAMVLWNNSEVTDIADLLDDHIVVFAACRCLRLDDIDSFPWRWCVYVGGGIGRAL